MHKSCEQVRVFKHVERKNAVTFLSEITRSTMFLNILANNV